jgi:E3 ubiquitin-protein ligase RNF115/126
MLASDCDCTICQENYELGEETIKLPCNHYFHPDCVLPWFEAHDNCPVCRMVLPANTDVAAPASESTTSLDAFD